MGCQPASFYCAAHARRDDATKRGTCSLHGAFDALSLIRIPNRRSPSGVFEDHSDSSRREPNRPSRIKGFYYSGGQLVERSGNLPLNLPQFLGAGWHATIPTEERVPFPLANRRTNTADNCKDIPNHFGDEGAANCVNALVDGSIIKGIPVRKMPELLDPSP